MNNAKHILREYAEGNLNTIQFWTLYKENPKIAILLKKDKTINYETYYSPGILENHFNVEDIFERYGLYEFVKSYMIRHNIKCVFYNEDESYITLIRKIQPTYVDVRNQKFWDSLINTCPTFKTEKEKITFLQERVNALFKFNLKPPKWIQPPEWPIENNYPLKFLKQVKTKCGYKYYFINEESKIPKIVEQFY